MSATDLPLADAEHPRLRRLRWVVTLATMFCYLFYYTGRQSIGFAINGIADEFDIGKDTLGWVSTAFLWSYAVGQAINGNLGDRFGGRRMMSLGAVLSCGLVWVVSFAGGFLSLLFPWALNGYAQSLGWAPGSRVLANWWPENQRGKVFGLYVFAAGMSSVVAFVTSLLILEVYELDWRWIFRLPVLLLLLGGVVYFFLVRDHPKEFLQDADEEEETPEKPEQTEKPERLQQPETPEKPYSSPVRAPDQTPAPVTGEERSIHRYLQVLRNRRFLIASVAIGFQNTARYGLLIWVPVHFLGKQYKDDPAGKWITIALPIGMALGALTNGWLSDRLFRSRRWPGITLFMGLASAASLAMWFVPQDNLALGIVMLFFCGFFAYGPQASFWALVPDLLGRERAGTGTGMMNASAYFFAGLGEPFIGWMTERFDDSSLVFPIVAVVCLVSAVIAPFIRR
jgi:OPA family glycerol-3-phosphate transporter-like MFS transporter